MAFGDVVQQTGRDSGDESSITNLALVWGDTGHPANPTSGNLLILVCGNRASGNYDFSSEGWTEVYTVEPWSNSSSTRSYVFAKIAGTSESDLTFTVTNGRPVYWLIEVEGPFESLPTNIIEYSGHAENASVNNTSGLQPGTSGTLSQSSNFAVAASLYRGNDVSGQYPSGGSVDESFTLGTPYGYDGASNFTLGLVPAYKVTSATTALNPTITWTMSASSTTFVTVSMMVVFKAQSTGATLTVADAACVTQADAVALTQAHSLTVNDGASTTQTDAVALVQNFTLAVNDAACTTQSDAIALTQAHGLTVTDAACTTQTDAVTLTQIHNLTAADAASETQTDAVTLSQLHNLIVNDAASTTQADNVTLSTALTLVVADAACTTQTDAVTIAQVHNLALADAAVTTQTDNVDLVYTGALVVQDAACVTQTDALALTQVHNLAIADASAVTQVDEVILIEYIHLPPASDSYVGNWTTNTGATSNLYQAVDEALAANDSDYIQSEQTPSASPVVLALTAGSDPTSSDGHVLRYRYALDGSGAINLTVQLRQGYVDEGSPGTLIAEWTHNGIGAITTAEQTLSGAQADSISNYGSLFVRMVATEV